MFHLKMISLNIGGIAGAFFAVFFFCGLQSKTSSCAKAEPRSKQKKVGKKARGKRQ